MRHCTLARPLRVVLASSLAAFLAVGSSGCGGDEGTKTGATGQLPESVKEGNNAMEKFQKEQAQKKP